MQPPRANTIFEKWTFHPFYPHSPALARYAATTPPLRHAPESHHGFASSRRSLLTTLHSPPVTRHSLPILSIPLFFVLLGVFAPSWFHSLFAPLATWRQRQAGHLSKLNKIKKFAPPNLKASQQLTRHDQNPPDFSLDFPQPRCTFR